MQLTGHDVDQRQSTAPFEVANCEQLASVDAVS